MPASRTRRSVSPATFRSLTTEDWLIALYPRRSARHSRSRFSSGRDAKFFGRPDQRGGLRDRKSTRLNSSHLVISYAVFCLKKKNISTNTLTDMTLDLSAALR